MFHFTTILGGLALAALAAAIPIGSGNDSLSDRSIICEKSRIKHTIVVGDGNPHQNFIYKQISPTTDCTNNPGGSAAVSTETSIGYSLSISGELDFITAGFDVSVSTSTGYSNSFGCGTVDDNGVAGSQKGSLCVFERIQTTAYTVNTATCDINFCGGQTCSNDKGPNTIIYAPNTVQGSCFYDNFQLNLPCGVLGTQHDVHSGPAGGPQFIAC